MKFSCFKQDLRSSNCFSGVLFSSWLAASILCPTCQNISVLVRALFGLVTPLLALWLLRNFGYFTSLRLRPRKGDIFSVETFIFASTFFVYVLFSIFLGWGFCPFKQTLFAALLLGALAFSADYMWNALRKVPRKRKVVLELLDSEKEELINDIEDNGYLEGLEFLTTNDLKKAVLNGTTKEIGLIVISPNVVSGFDVDGVLLRAHLEGIPIVSYQNLKTDITGRVQLSSTNQGDFVLEATKQTFSLRMYRKLKMKFEPLFATFLIIVLSPLFLLIALLIKHSSPGPVFYKQTRTGYLGRTFTLIKFRTMREDAEVNGPKWASGSEDPRATKIGTFLRKTRLDELPQLINVIRGEMGFFGPRPERPEMYAMLKDDIPLFKMRTLVLPGVTGWAQVCAGYAGSIVASKIKLEFDLYYIKRMTPLLDITIFIKTILVAFEGDKGDRMLEFLEKEKIQEERRNAVK